MSMTISKTMSRSKPQDESPYSRRAFLPASALLPGLNPETAQQLNILRRPTSRDNCFTNADFLNPRACPPPKRDNTAPKHESTGSTNSSISSTKSMNTASTRSSKSSTPNRKPSPSRRSARRPNLFNTFFPAGLEIPPVKTSAVTVLLLPQNGTAPHMLRIRTIDIRKDSSHDSCLSHIPDMRSFWGAGREWTYRRERFSSLSHVKGDKNHPLTGTYVFLYTPFNGSLGRNKRWKEGVFGDACICKMGKNGDITGVAEYEDVAREFIDSGLWKKFLDGLFVGKEESNAFSPGSKNFKSSQPLHYQNQSSSSHKPIKPKKSLFFIPLTGKVTPTASASAVYADPYSFPGTDSDTGSTGPRPKINMPNSSRKRQASRKLDSFAPAKLKISAPLHRPPHGQLCYELPAQVPGPPRRPNRPDREIDALASQAAPKPPSPVITQTSEEILRVERERMLGVSIMKCRRLTRDVDF